MIPDSKMGVFHFKQFDVINERSAMKVNTDGVLLGAFTEVLPSDRKVLDIGTGTGTVALMVAQRLSELNPDFEIHAIDIDAPSAGEAASNFESSPWKGHLLSFNSSLKNFDRDDEYDLILSNPPYFDNSLQAPQQRRNAARHTGVTSVTEEESLSYRDVLEYSQKHLAPSGRVALVLPADQEKALLRHARMCGLVPWKLLRVRTVPRKQPSRVVVRFVRRGQPVTCVEEEFTLMNEAGKRTTYPSPLDHYLLDA